VHSLSGNELDPFTEGLAMTAYLPPKLHLFVAFIGTTLFSVVICRSVDAQQNVYIQTPFQSMNDSYYEYIGTNWGFQRSGPNGGFFFNNGGFGPPPAFGGYDGSASTFGFGGEGFRFNMIAAQGSSRSNTVNAPSITMIPGTYGSLQHGQIRPFVTGIIPIVGSNFGRPPMRRIVHRPSWDEAKVRDYVTRRREQKAVELKKEAAQAVELPPLTRQNDDPPLFLKGQ